MLVSTTTVSGEIGTGTVRRVLVVDDDDVVLRAHVRALSRRGFQVEGAASGSEALTAIRNNNFDVIFSDIAMPGISGIALLEEVRHVDLDVPVVMITGAPTVDTAASAMQHGALRYLLKPVDLNELVKVADDAVRHHNYAKAQRKALDLAGGDRYVDNLSAINESFTRALETLTIAYQPIVSWSGQSVFAHEALMRPKEPTLPHPGAMLEAAERLDRLRDLGRRVRELVAQQVSALPADALLFVNLDPTDLMDDDIYSPTSALAPYASRIVLEMTERSSLSGVQDLRGRIGKLQALGFRIAIDDIGAGYAGLTSFTMFEPDVVKLDMGLVRDAHTQPTKRTLLRTMIAMCNELGIVVTAEGIEVAAERDALLDAGCDLMQGYLFAKPGPAFPTPRW